jgi:hypothetical protein
MQGVRDFAYDWACEKYARIKSPARWPLLCKYENVEKPPRGVTIRARVASQKAKKLPFPRLYFARKKKTDHTYLSCGVGGLRSRSFFFFLAPCGHKCFHSSAAISPFTVKSGSDSSTISLTAEVCCQLSTLYSETLTYCFSAEDQALT